VYQYIVIRPLQIDLVGCPRVKHENAVLRLFMNC